MSHIAHETVLIALDDKNDKVIGACIAGPKEAGDAEKMLEESEKSEKKWGDIQKLVAYIGKKADVFGKFNVEKALYCHALAVHRDYRGNKIGQKLFEKSFENAKKLNFKILFADCTSVFSIKISEQVGMECVSTVTYDEFNKVIGQELFLSHPPNTQIKTFVKRL
jgi:GNAT superfamily N-acetyltransferase